MRKVGKRKDDRRGKGRRETKGGILKKEIACLK